LQRHAHRTAVRKARPREPRNMHRLQDKRLARPRTIPRTRTTRRTRKRLGPRTLSQLHLLHPRRLLLRTPTIIRRHILPHSRRRRLHRLLQLPQGTIMLSGPRPRRTPRPTSLPPAPYLRLSLPNRSVSQTSVAG
jgi:hypothetical protein